MIYFLLFWEYFKIGLFAIGGGYATLPFLYHLSEVYHWFSLKQLSDMLAISAITPGPVGINMATYSGFTTAGVFGSLIATVSIVAAPLLIVLVVAKLLKHFEDNFYVKSALYGLRPAACAMLASVLVHLLKLNFQETFNLKALVVLILLFIIGMKMKNKPVILIVISGILGFIVNLYTYK